MPPATYQAALDAEPSPEIVAEASGAGTVEAYTVQHGRDGRPAVGIVVVRLADGRRCWANLTDAAILDRMEQEEFVGRAGQVRHHAPTRTNVFEP